VIYLVISLAAIQKIFLKKMDSVVVVDSVDLKKCSQGKMVVMGLVLNLGDFLKEGKNV